MFRPRTKITFAQVLELKKWAKRGGNRYRYVRARAKIALFDHGGRRQKLPRTRIAERVGVPLSFIYRCLKEIAENGVEVVWKKQRIRAKGRRALDLLRAYEKIVDKGQRPDVKQLVKLMRTLDGSPERRDQAVRHQLRACRTEIRNLKKKLALRRKNAEWYRDRHARPSDNISTPAVRSRRKL